MQWIPDAVSRVDVPRNEAVLAKGPRIRYDFLVLAPGVQRNWDALPGISRAALGEHGIHSVHDREGVARTAQALKQTVSTGGRAIFADAGGSGRVLQRRREDGLPARGRPRAVAR